MKRKNKTKVRVRGRVSKRSAAACASSPQELSLQLTEGHCDDYIDSEAAPAALRKFLEFARAPAHGAFMPKPHPQLYADHEGSRVRVTMASVMGDVGITSDLSREMGYERRVLVSALSNFSETP